MAEIKVSAWERNDLLRILDYAKKKKAIDYETGYITQQEFEMDLEKINTILQRLTGTPYKQDYNLQSSKGGVQTINERDIL